MSALGAKELARSRKEVCLHFAPAKDDRGRKRKSRKKIEKEKQVNRKHSICLVTSFDKKRNIVFLSIDKAIRRFVLPPNCKVLR